MINKIWEGKSPYIIAEVSQNHDGSLGQAHAFIDAVATAGAQAIKFQTHIAEEESTPDEPFRVNFSYCDKTRYDYWKRMEFTEEQWKGLYDHASEKNLIFLSSPFSVKALKMLDRIGVPAWKFGSGEVFNTVLLDRALETGKPIIISTGLSTVDDIDRQSEKIRTKGNQLIIMHCTTAYPTKPDQIALNRIKEIKDRYNCAVGLSDHSGEIYPSLAAIALGAQVIEVHVTFSKDMFGPDVKASVNMDQLKQITEGSRWIYDCLRYSNDRTIRSTEQENLKRIFGKSLYASRDIEFGEILREDMIAIKKPLAEIPAESYYDILGKRTVKEIKYDTPIKWMDMETI